VRASTAREIVLALDNDAAGRDGTAALQARLAALTLTPARPVRVIAWPDGVPVLGNLLAAYPWTQALTWLLQIMPLFFWAGVASAALAAGTGTNTFTDTATASWLVLGSARAQRGRRRRPIARRRARQPPRLSGR